MFYILRGMYEVTPRASNSSRLRYGARQLKLAMIIYHILCAKVGLRSVDIEIDHSFIRRCFDLLASFGQACSAPSGADAS